MPSVSSLNLSPKFHGAWLGAGTGAAISNIIAGLFQTYVTRKALPAADLQGIYAVVSIVLTAFGAYIMPAGKPKPARPAVTMEPAVFTTVHPAIPPLADPPATQPGQPAVPAG